VQWTNFDRWVIETGNDMFRCKTTILSSAMLKIYQLSWPDNYFW